MDITEFSDDNFDPKEWVNKTLKSLDGDDNKEISTASIVSKLQLYVQQVNSSIEDTSQQILQSMPRIMRDIKSVQIEAITMKEKMAMVKSEIMKVEQDTAQSMHGLERIDRIKTALEEARHGLHEADNWTIIANDMEELFESGDVQLISEKLARMEQSLKILTNVTDYEDRKLRLDGLKNRLEAIVSPSVVQAFTSANLDQSLMYSKIFASIDRVPQLVKYYHKCERGVLLQKWRDHLELEADEPMAQWAHTYYNALISNWHTQCKFLSAVFPSVEARSVLAEVYADLLASLDPGLGECLDAALKQTSDKLGLLCELKQSAQQFADNLLRLLQGPNVSKELQLTLCKAVFSPFVPHVARYAAYEQAWLVHQVDALQCLKEDDRPETVRSLGLAMAGVLDVARAAKRRCELFTENCGYAGLLVALKACLGHYVDLYRVALRQVSRARSHDEDWALFQDCLHLLQHLGELSAQTLGLENALATGALDVRRNQVADYRHLLLDQPGLKEYDSLVKSVKSGMDLSLLADVTSDVQKLCSDVHHATYLVIFGPISSHLDLPQMAKGWNEEEANLLVSLADLPDYGFAPQEYITQIGQYLMTLPQHLEPFLMSDNPWLTCALKAADPEYSSPRAEEEGGLAYILLGFVAKGTCQSYTDSILSIRELKANVCRQLAHDIDYLGNVLEDLGLGLTDSLKQISVLLKIPADQYQSASTGNARLVSAIRHIRNITSSG